MKKQLHILKGLMILSIIFISSLLLIKFIYYINHKKIDTSYIWNISLNNIQIAEGSEEANISIDKNKIDLKVTLKEENDFLEATFDIENKGSLNAILEDYKLNIDNQKNILKYKITYLDNSEIQKGDIINSKTKETIKLLLNLKYKQI